MSRPSLRQGALLAIGLAACGGMGPGARAVEMETARPTGAARAPTNAPAPPRHVELQATMDGICELDGGIVRCAGRNLSGEVGDGTREPHPEWFRVPGTEGAVQLAAGGAHVCVRIDDGTARCWGRNDVGQLGLGVGGEPRTAPAQVVGLRNIEEIRAGIFHTCARLASGEVHCWGGKIDGVALGFDLDPASRLRITRIVGGATRLVVGHERTYARTRTGWVTWAPQRGPAPAARATPDLDEAVEIASGWSDECALGKQGEVTCWGASHASSFPRRHEPEAAMLVPNLPAALRVSVGRAHACALVVGGAVHCWREIHGYRPALPSPEKVAGVADAVDLTSGFDFSCARTRDGRVRCWGRTESLPADSSLGE